MSNEDYRPAAWAAIGSAVFSLAEIGLTFFFDYGKNRPFTPPVWTPQQLSIALTMAAVAAVLGIYAILRFRHLLNTRYNFHAVDNLILLMIVGNLVVLFFSSLARIILLYRRETAIPAALVMVVMGVVLGVIGIVFARRLMRLNGNLNGYKIPLVYIQMAGSICLLTGILAPVALVLFCVFDLLLSQVFFKGEDLEELEVV